VVAASAARAETTRPQAAPVAPASLQERPAGDPLALAQQALSRGRLEEVERLLDGAASDARSALLLGKVAERRGRLDRAESLYRSSASADRLGDAALDLGLLLVARGRREEGRSVLQAFVDRAASFDSPAGLARAARAARALGEHRLANGLYREAAAAAPDSPHINTAWGDLLLEKHNLPEAARSYQLALKADPDFAPAHLGMARALQEENPPAARAAAARALQSNPALWEAALLDAAILFDSGEREQATAIVDRVLVQNPASLEAHALRAAIAWVEDRLPDYERAVADALAINPGWGEAYRIVAEHAAGKYRFDDAAALARKATALDASNAQAWADLGKHLLRVGDEVEGRAALERAFEQDPYNEVTFNLLGMLDKLKDFEVVEAGPLVIKLHPDEAPMMRDAVARLATDALRALSARYAFTPRGPILVEMFPEHDDFAVRNVGLPGMIGALGACFGRVVTLDSPKARRPPGSFNWAATLWHELAHVVTLQMSGQRVPRWLTEGISVFEERRARPSWGREAELQFVQALADGTTFPLASLNTGFSDPRRITLAYHQASLVAEHVVERFGDDALGRLLRAYGEGLDDEAALRKAAGIGVADLQQSFDAFVEKRFGSQKRALETVDGLEEAVAGGDPDALDSLARQHPGSFRVQMALGQVRLQRKELDAAAAAFARAAALLPAATGEDGPRALLAKVAQARGDDERYRATLADAVAEHYTALELARSLLKAAESAGDRERVRLAAERVVEVEPSDASAHAALGRLALADGEADAAMRAFRLALLAGPADLVAAHTDLAEALLATGARADAKQEAVVALEMAPRYERAQEVLLAVVDGEARDRPR
jgi:tetratricopeptide (TPR) repeat protein